MTNESWVVAHPSGGAYEPSCFRLEQGPIPTPPDGHIVVETKLLSLDPTHLNWVKLDPAFQFFPIGLGDTMIGTNIGIVVQSRHLDFEVGQGVMGTWGWERFAVASPAFVQPALPESEMPWADQLTILSHVGLAAAGGMLVVGNVQPQDAVLVSAAAGATGSIAAQIAKAKGCRTVGIAGGADKCRFLIESLGLDGAIDYRNEDLGKAIARHFPQGVDLFFDNVGGETLDAVLLNMAQHCRIVVCGAISQYDQSAAADFKGIHNLPMMLFRQATMTGFIAGTFGDRNAEIAKALSALYDEGKLKAPVHITSFADMPETLSLLLTGGNRGKLLAKID